MNTSRCALSFVAGNPSTAFFS